MKRNFGIVLRKTKSGGITAGLLQQGYTHEFMPGVCSIEILTPETIFAVPCPSLPEMRFTTTGIPVDLPAILFSLTTCHGKALLCHLVQDALFSKQQPLYLICGGSMLHCKEGAEIPCICICDIDEEPKIATIPAGDTAHHNAYQIRYNPN